MVSKEIDRIDAKLLWLLDYDARKPLRELATAVRLSKQNVHYRLKRLQEKGIIRKAVSVIDPHKLGLLTYRVYVRYKGMTLEHEQALIAYLQQHPSVIWCITCTGSWDLEIVYGARNYLHLNRMLQELKKGFNERLARLDISMSIANRHFQRDYLVGATRDPGPDASYGHEPQHVPLDELDKQLLGLLSEDCRRTNTELGKALGVTYHTVKARVKRLEATGVVSAHRLLIDWARLGRKYYKLLLTLNDPAGVQGVAAAQPSVVYVVETLGHWQLEIEMEVANDDEPVALLRELRTRFPDAISDYDVLKVQREHRLNYYPHDTR